MTMASSTSQSVLVEPLGIMTSSFGPTTQDRALLKRTGSLGTGMPDSAAGSGKLRQTAMKLAPCATHGPILGVPRTADRDSGLSLARRASERGLSTSASMSLTTSLKSRNFPLPSPSAVFSFPALPYRASFISPPLKPPIIRNRHRARLLGG